jgi:hypothetical protein
MSLVDEMKEEPVTGNLEKINHRANVQMRLIAACVPSITNHPKKQGKA